MTTLDITLNKELINRNAVTLVQLLTPIKSEIYINKESRRINAKSILGVLSASINKGDEVIFEIFEDSEVATVNQILQNFNEE